MKKLAILVIAIMLITVSAVMVMDGFSAAKVFGGATMVFAAIVSGISIHSKLISK